MRAAVALLALAALPRAAGAACTATVVCPHGSKLNSFESEEGCKSALEDQFKRYAKLLQGCSATPCQCDDETKGAKAAQAERRAYVRLMSAVEALRHKGVARAEELGVRDLDRVKLDRIRVRPPERGSSEDDAYRAALGASFDATAAWLGRATGGDGCHKAFDALRVACRGASVLGLLDCYRRAAEDYNRCP